MAQESSDLTRREFDELTEGRGDEFMATAPVTDVDTGNDETGHIKAQIEETRNQMGETIDALQEKLSFSNLSEQVSEHVSNAIETAKNSVYDATVGKAVGFMRNMGDGIGNSGFVRTARNNPFPLVLIGLGAGLLAYNAYSGAGNRRRRSFRSEPRSPRHEFDRAEQAATAETGSTFGGLTEKASHLTDRVSTAANSAYESASTAVDSAVTGARDLANRAYEKAGEYGNVAYETYDHYLEENPLAVGAAAFALGAVVGLAIPATRYEGQLMGETRDQLLQKAQDQGSRLLDKTRHLVDEAASTVSKESRNIIH